MRFSNALSWPVFILAVTAFTAGCSSKHAHRHPTMTSAPPVNVSKLASKAFDQFKAKTPLDEDPRANAYVVCVAEAVVRNIGGDWGIALFRRDASHAFVLPGGKIGVYSGLLRTTRNQHQLAAIIAHGLAHVIARHPDLRVAEQMRLHPGTDLMRALDRPSSAEGQLVMDLLGVEPDGGQGMPFGRAQESAANVLGLDLMARAGFDPKESINVWKSLERGSGTRLGLLAMHPSYGSRVTEFEQHLPAATALQSQSLAGRKKPECDRLR